MSFHLPNWFQTARDPRRFQRRLSALLTVAALGVGLADAVMAAVPAIDDLSVARGQDDLVLFWMAPQDPVDGYRVYRYQTRGCDVGDLVYQGTAPTWADVGAFNDKTDRLYRVLAYRGTELGQLTGPVYKLPTHILNPKLVSFSTSFTPSTADGFCSQVNSLPSGPALNQVIRVRDSMPWTHVCGAPFADLSLNNGEAFFLRPIDWGLPGSTGKDMWLWGYDPVGAAMTTVLDTVAGPILPNSSVALGTYWISLPNDHAYADLQSVADDIANAIEVTIYGDTQSGQAEAHGLTRASSGDPWQGENLSLKGLFPYGVQVLVDQPSSFTPQRASCMAPPGSSGGQPGDPVSVPGGPYDSLCSGGITGIWLDGAASFDPDGGPLTYEWTTTCSGTIANPTQAVTAVVFDCNPCSPLGCDVTLKVTDVSGRSASESVAVTTFSNSSCFQTSNRLLAVKTPSGVDLTWLGADPADNFALFRASTSALNGPKKLTCGAGRGFLDGEMSAENQYYSLAGIADPCAQ